MRAVDVCSEGGVRWSRAVFLRLREAALGCRPHRRKLRVVSVAPRPLFVGGAEDFLSRPH